MAAFSCFSFLLSAFDHQPLINSTPHQPPPPTHLQAVCTPDTNHSSSRMTTIHDSNETHSPAVHTSMAPIKLQNPGDNDAVAQTKKKKKKRADCRNGSSSQEGAEGRTNKKQKKSNINNGVVKQEEKLKVSLEPPKGYIHVRARRGEATDSHSLAERVRREKISERMKMLQQLVPGCDKITGKALVLDEIIKYVQSLQNHVEFLSMKLAFVNPTMFGDFTMGQDTLLMGATERLLNTAIASPLPSLPQCSDNQATNFAADDSATVFLQGAGRSNVFSNSLDVVGDQLWDLEDLRQNFPDNPNYGFSTTLWSFDC